MRSNKRIATLTQTLLVMGVLAAAMMRAPAFAQTSQVDNASRGQHESSSPDSNPPRASAPAPLVCLIRLTASRLPFLHTPPNP